MASLPERLRMHLQKQELTRRTLLRLESDQAVHRMKEKAARRGLTDYQQGRLIHRQVAYTPKILRSRRRKKSGGGMFLSGGGALGGGRGGGYGEFARGRGRGGAYATGGRVHRRKTDWQKRYDRAQAGIAQLGRQQLWTTSGYLQQGRLGKQQEAKMEIEPRKSHKRLQRLGIFQPTAQGTGARKIF